jgi:uncharacterized protein (DUF433 family)
MRHTRSGLRHEEKPRYAFRDAARYLGVPATALRAWVAGPRGRRPVSRRADPYNHDVTFNDLAEAHLLQALRRQRRLSLRKVRTALASLSREFGWDRPLLEHGFATEGLDSFVERYGQLIGTGREGRLGLRLILDGYLRRVEWDAHGRVARFYPFTRGLELDEPCVVAIDPRVAFGCPVIAGTNVPTWIVAQRWRAGEPIGDLARDYGRQTLEIEEALRCERAA